MSGLASIAVARAGVLDGTRPARALVQACLDRARTEQDRLFGFISLQGEAALAEAGAVDERARRGETLPPLAGIPISVKDVVDVGGVPTTGASFSQEGVVPQVDAPVVARLRQAGAIVLGKANCHELSFGGPSFDLPVPPARNPWDPDRFPGGSSSGAGVTVSAGMCLGAVGTDTAGSIRLPATLCGVVGLKPGFGVLPLDGIRPLSPAMDHVGPLARCAADARALFRAMRDGGAAADGAGDADLRAGDLRGLRIGLPGPSWRLADRMQIDVARAYGAAVTRLEEAGVKLVTLDLPAFEELHAIGAVLMMGEVAETWAGNVRGDFARYGRMFRGRALVGEMVPAAARGRATTLRKIFARRFEAALSRVDALLLPGALAPAVPIADVHPYYFIRDPSLTIVANVTRSPALSFPAGLSEGGLPVGLQLVGAAGSEERLLDLLEGIEAVHPPARMQDPPGLGGTQ